MEHATLIPIMKQISFVFILSLLLVLPHHSLAVTNVCPGEPQTLNWSSSNVGGSCVPSASIPSCSFSVVPNTTNSSVITTTQSCSVSLTCDGVTANDSITINPNQSRCCGNWALSGSSTWNGALGYCVPSGPAINTFTVSPTTVAYNSAATLTWTTTGATSCTIDQGIGSVPISGSISTGNRTTTTTFNLTCINGSGQNTIQSATLTVNPAPLATIGSLTTNPSNPVPYGTVVTVAWNGLTGVASGTITIGGAPTVLTPGQYSGGSVSTPPIYTNTPIILTVSNPQGTNTATSTTITVLPVPTASLTVSPAAIPYNSISTLSWTSTQSTCTLNGASVGATNGGTPTANLIVDTTYTLDCRNAANYSVTDQKTVSVGRQASANITGATSCNIPAGSSSCSITFSWISSGMDNPNANFGGCRYAAANYGNPCTTALTNVPTISGTQSYTVTPTGIYVRVAGTPDNDVYTNPITLGNSAVDAIGICTGGSSWNGSICNCPTGYTANSGNCDADVAIGTFTVNGGASANIPYSGGVTLDWTGVTGQGVTCSINTLGPVTGFPVGSRTVSSLTSNITYTLTCSNGAGPNATRSVTVTVDPVPTAALSASPTSIPYNSQTMLSWTSSNATSCTLDGTTVAASYPGMLGGNLTATKTYTLICRNAANYASAASTQTITVGRQATATVTGNTSCTIAAGASSCPITFSWLTTGINNPNVDFRGCAYSASNYGGSCVATGYNVIANTSGTQTYNATGNGISVRVTGTPDYNVYMDPLGSGYLQAIGNCISGSTWNGSICGCPPNEVDTTGVCVNPSPTGIDITPKNMGMTLGNSQTFTITAADIGNDIQYSNLNWRDPGATQYMWQSGNYTGATVTPGVNGSVTYSGGTPTVNQSYTFTPTRVGNYAIYGAVRDTANPWISTPEFTITVCPATAPWSIALGRCENPIPTVSITGPSSTNVYVNYPLTYTINANDIGLDIVGDALRWRAPGQSLWSYANNGLGGRAYVGSTLTTNGYNNYITSPRSSGATTFTFTPTQKGDYALFGTVFDNIANVSAPGRPTDTAGLIAISADWKDPTINATMTPSTVAYGGSFNTLSYLARDASRCDVYTRLASASSWGAPSIPNSSTSTMYWGLQPGYASSTSWRFVCSNPNGITVEAIRTLTVCLPGEEVSGNACVPGSPTNVEIALATSTKRGVSVNGDFAVTNSPTLPCKLEYSVDNRATFRLVGSGNISPGQTWSLGALANTVGTVDYRVTCKKPGVADGVDTKTITILDCSVFGQQWDFVNNKCIVPPPPTAPSVNLTPTTPQAIILGQTVTLNSSASDVNYDMVEHKLEWVDPDGVRWSDCSDNINGANASAAHDAVVTPGNAICRTFSPRATSTASHVFRPTKIGIYTVQYTAGDATDRWGFSNVITVSVTDPAPTGLSIAVTPATVDSGETFVLNYNSSPVTGSCTVWYSFAGGNWVTLYDADVNGTGNSFTSPALTTGPTTSFKPGVTEFRLQCFSQANGAGTPSAFVYTNPDLRVNAGTSTVGTITAANSCLITLNQSTCSVPASWTTVNPVGTSRVYKVDTPTDALLYTANNGSGTFVVDYSSSDFYIRNNGVTVGTKTITASCEAGTSWDGIRCAVGSGPSITVTTAPASVIAGNYLTTFGWTSTGVMTNGCRLKEATFDGTSWVFPTASSTAPANYNPNTNSYPGQINVDRRWNVTCYDSSGRSASRDFGVTAIPSGSVVTGTISSTPCLIAIGSPSCSSTVTWNTNNATGTVAVVRGYSPFGAIPGGNVSTGNSTVTFPYGSFLINLTHSGITLTSTTVNAICSGGSVWNGTTCSCPPGTTDISGTCTPSPSVLSATITPNSCTLANPPTLALTCANADSYDVQAVSTGLSVSPAPGPTPAPTITLPITAESYRVTCLQGAVSSSPVIRNYSPTLCTTSNISITASPRTIRKSSVSTISWAMLGDSSACRLTVTPVCPANPSDPTSCAADPRGISAAALNDRFASTTSDMTDANDPYGQRNIFTALTVPVTLTPTVRTAGKKSLQIDYTTDFQLQCGTLIQKVRVLVTNDNEG